MFILFPLAKPARVIFIPKAVFTEKSVGAEREIIILTPNFALLRRISDDTLPVNSKMLSDGLKSKIKLFPIILSRALCRPISSDIIFLFLLYRTQQCVPMVFLKI